jgi:hypothetical protein
MIYPVENKKITSPYGMRTLDGRKPVFHYGIDFTGKNKFSVAPCDIKIDKVLNIDIDFPCKFKFSGGHFVIDESVPVGRAWTPFVIAHSVINPDITFVFKHVKPLVSAGAEIKEGEPVGEIGNYGFSMGAHLHFEVMIRGKNINPEKWLIENVG